MSCRPIVRVLVAFACALTGLVGLSARSIAAVRAPLEVLIEPQSGPQVIYQAIKGARSRIDIEMYELEDPVVDQLLIAAEAHGLRVRVILNRTYTGSSNEPAYRELSGHHVPVRFAPSANDITHEKAIVIDGALALVMTMNLTARYYRDTRDVIVADRIPEDVAAIETVFAADWKGARRDAPLGRDLLWSPGASEVLVALISSARQAVILEAEEMADRTVIDALERDAQRGVRVVVVMTEESRWRAVFTELSRHGVIVETHPDNASVLYIHAKAIVIDHERAFVGSQNFSVTSLERNRELGIVTSDPAVVDALVAMIGTDLTGAMRWRS